MGVRHNDIDLGINVGSDCSRKFTTDYTIQDREVADKVFNRGLVGGTVGRESVWWLMHDA